MMQYADIILYKKNSFPIKVAFLVKLLGFSFVRKIGMFPKKGFNKYRILQRKKIKIKKKKVVIKNNNSIVSCKISDLKLM